MNEQQKQALIVSSIPKRPYHGQAQGTRAGARPAPTYQQFSVPRRPSLREQQLVSPSMHIDGQAQVHISPTQQPSMSKQDSLQSNEGSNQSAEPGAIINDDACRQLESESPLAVSKELVAIVNDDALRPKEPIRRMQKILSYPATINVHPLLPRKLPERKSKLPSCPATINVHPLQPRKPPERKSALPSCPATINVARSKR